MMVTDGQYKELQNKVIELEKKLDILSQQLSRLMLKNDAVIDKKVIVAPSKKRDTTKYCFNGQIYCKRRIVYACIKQYMTDNNVDTYAQLTGVFPDYIQGSLGVIKPAEFAEKYANAHRRFYFSDEDIIFLEGHPYVVCSQWEKKNIDRFLKVVQELGYIIDAICYE